MSAMKRIFDEITEISEATGYSVDFLSKQVDETAEDYNGNYNKALNEVRVISYEHDW